MPDVVEFRWKELGGREQRRLNEIDTDKFNEQLAIFLGPNLIRSVEKNPASRLFGIPLTFAMNLL